MTGWFPKPSLLSQFLRFLALPRQSTRGLTDSTTLTTDDFDVDNQTGFMPPQPPLARLPGEWEAWEVTLDSALTKRLKLYDGPTTTDDDHAEAATWREGVYKVGMIPAIAWMASIEVNG